VDATIEWLAGAYRHEPETQKPARIAPLGALAFTDGRPLNTSQLSEPTIPLKAELPLA
jgi:hypothetical protein